MSVAVIINPNAGRPSARGVRERVALATSVLDAAHVPGEVFVTERPRHASDLTAHAVARGAHLVVAWGGDGTVNEVAAALVKASLSAALGIIPAGSGNGLARELKVASDPARALREAIAAQSAVIDCGEVNGRLFVSVAGVGLDAQIARGFALDTSGRRGFSTYARITARELFRYRCGTVRIDGAVHPSTLFVTFANTSQFGNGARIAPNARVDDGALDLVVVREGSRVASVCALPRLFLGGLARVPGVTMTRVEQVRVESETPMVYHVDGEPVEGGTRLDVRVLPGVLRVALR
ncbi:MAG: diacylglycerol kinase family lipid kinase [Acidobacteriaceae bacterium]|jgi:YegS/Rv2252/BmrU family lipid kinase|nr:diacylglycerol kinase family lipid kinase [Acidobacteriaceae bacterium]